MAVDHKGLSIAVNNHADYQSSEASACGEFVMSVEAAFAGECAQSSLTLQDSGYAASKADDAFMLRKSSSRVGARAVEI